MKEEREGNEIIAVYVLPASNCGVLHTWSYILSHCNNSTCVGESLVLIYMGAN